MGDGGGIRFRIDGLTSRVYLWLLEPSSGLFFDSLPVTQALPKHCNIEQAEPERFAERLWES